MPPAKKARKTTTVKRTAATRATRALGDVRASTANRRASPKSVRPGTRLSSTPIRPTPQQKKQVEEVAMKHARKALSVRQLTPEQKKEVRKGISMAYKKLAVGGLAGLAVLAGGLKGYNMYDAQGFQDNISDPFDTHIAQPFNEHIAKPFSEHVSTPISSSLSSFGQHAGEYIKGATTNWNPWNESGHGWHDIYKGVTGDYGGGRRPMTVAERRKHCHDQGKVMDRITKRCRLARGSPGSPKKRKTVSEKMAKKKALMETCRKWTGKTGAYPKGSFKAGKKGCKLRAGARMKKSYRKKKQGGQQTRDEIRRRANARANWSIAHNTGVLPLIATTRAGANKRWWNKQKEEKMLRFTQRLGL